MKNKNNILKKPLTLDELMYTDDLIIKKLKEENEMLKKKIANIKKILEE